MEVGRQIPTSTAADPFWTENPVERLFSFPDVFTHSLFASVCREHLVKPYEFKRKVRYEMIVIAPKKSIERVAADFTRLQREMNNAVWMSLVDLIEMA